MPAESHPDRIETWRSGYDGLLYDDRDPRFRSLVYGWDTGGLDSPAEKSIPAQGAVWGFVQRGSAAVASPGGELRIVREAEFFVTSNGADLALQPATRLLAVQQVGFLAIPVTGGPVEPRGRLRYIDGCSDSLLVAPAVAGDPCLNHLHFPPGIDQTRHTHPSTRAGIVARGRGSCATTSGDLPLVQGLIFVIPTGGVHAFRTDSDAMDVIAYHPDSDHGPRHEDHPMVNRTLVDGRKVDNSRGAHLSAEVIAGRFDVESVITLDSVPEGRGATAD